MTLQDADSMYNLVVLVAGQITSSMFVPVAEIVLTASKVVALNCYHLTMSKSIKARCSKWLADICWIKKTVESCLSSSKQVKM